MRSAGNPPGNKRKTKLRATRLPDDFIAVMEPEGYVCPVQPADSYNGSAHENFTWSQSISDLDVLVKVPACLKNPDDLRVDVSTKRIKVEARSSVVLQSHDSPDSVAPQKANYSKAPGDPDEWTTILEGEFSFPTKKNESLWSLSPGECVNIHLEKAKERWWEALIIGEPKIELSRIDCSRDLFELGETEQMKVGELMWNHRRKIMGGQKP